MDLCQRGRGRLYRGADAVLQEPVDEPQDEVQSQRHGQADHEQPQQTTAQGETRIGCRYEVSFSAIQARFQSFIHGTAFFVDVNTVTNEHNTDELWYLNECE